MNESKSSSSLSVLTLRRHPRRRSRREVQKTFTLADPVPRATIAISSGRIYEFSRQTHNSTWITSSTTVPVYSAFAPTLSGVAGYTEFTGLFDQYRMTELEIWLIPRVLGGSTGNPGLFITSIDYDDNALPASFSELEENNSSVTTGGNVGRYMKFKPHIAMAAYGGAFTSYANQSDQWIDCGSPGVYQFGIKMAWTVTDQAYSYDLVTRYRLQFRNVR